MGSDARGSSMSDPDSDQPTQPSPADAFLASIVPADYGSAWSTRHRRPRRCAWRWSLAGLGVICGLVAARAFTAHPTVTRPASNPNHTLNLFLLWLCLLAFAWMVVSFQAVEVVREER